MCVRLNKCVIKRPLLQFLTPLPIPKNKIKIKINALYGRVRYIWHYDISHRTFSISIICWCFATRTLLLLLLISLLCRNRASNRHFVYHCRIWILNVYLSVNSLQHYTHCSGCILYNTNIYLIILILIDF